MSQNPNSNTNKAEPCKTCGGSGYDKPFGKEEKPWKWRTCHTCNGTGFTPPADTPAIPTSDLVGVDSKIDTNSPAAEAETTLREAGAKLQASLDSAISHADEAIKILQAGDKPEPTAESGELEQILSKLKYVVENRRITEKEWQAGIWFDVTNEARSAIQALLATANAEGRREELEWVITTDPTDVQLLQRRAYLKGTTDEA